MKTLILNQIPTDSKGNYLKIQFGKPEQPQAAILMNYGGRVINALRNSVFPDDITGEKALAAEAFAQRVEAHIEEGTTQINALITADVEAYNQEVATINQVYAEGNLAQVKQRKLAEAFKKLIAAQITKQDDMTSTIEVSDEEFEFINQVYVRERVAIRIPFLEMVKKLNTNEVIE